MNLAADQSVWPEKKRRQKPRCSRCWPCLHHLLHITYESALIHSGHSLRECSKIPVLVSKDPAQIIDYFQQLAMMGPPQTATSHTWITTVSSWGWGELLHHCPLVSAQPPSSVERARVRLQAQIAAPVAVTKSWLAGEVNSLLSDRPHRNDRQTWHVR